jgi:hypothetical protein
MTTITKNLLKKLRLHTFTREDFLRQKEGAGRKKHA